MARYRFLPNLRGGPPTPPVERKDILLADWYEPGGPRADRLPARDTETAVRDFYERLPWCYRAIETIASNASRLRFGIRAGRRPDDPELDDHPMIRLLNGKANRYETGRVLRKRVSQQLLTSKRGVFVEIVRNRRDDPVELHLLPPARTSAKSGKDRDGRVILVHHYEVAPPSGLGKPREIPAENVLWIREPHPLDPFRSMTPLEAAGLSLELDHFARVYNRNFMANDGRPGGLVGIDSDLDDVELDRVEAKLGPGGPRGAGRLIAVTGKLDYVDTSATPRDAHYPDASRTAKQEALGAFGVPESQMGHAAGTTFANGEVEAEAFWLITMANHLDAIEDGFDPETGDDTVNFHDVSGIDALGRAERRRREEERTETDAGVRTPNQYLEARGRERVEHPAMDAYYLPTGRIVVAANPAQQEALTAFITSANPTGGSVTEPRESDKRESGPAEPENRPALPAQVPGRGDPDVEPPPLDPDGERKAAESPSDSWQPADDDGRQLETELAAVLTALARRMTTVAVERLSGAKARRHTRHWEPPGDRPFDAGYAVQVARWQEEAVADTLNVLNAPAERAADEFLEAVGALDGKALQPGVARAVRRAVSEAAGMVGRSAARQAELLLKMIADTEAGGASIPELVAAVRAYGQRQAGWAAAVAIQAVTATLEGARAAAAEEAGERVVRRWRSRGDVKVRQSHRDADGQERPVGEPFLIGEERLRFPGDPLASFRETAGCRCRQQWRSVRTGRFVTAPQAKVRVVGRRIIRPLAATG